MKINKPQIFAAWVLVLILIFCSKTVAQFRFRESPDEGTITLLEGRLPILSYCFGDQLKPGVDLKYTRSCYIHPLYSLDGTQKLTVDFPPDHLHHHGVFWTWPVVKTREQDTQTWHPADPSLRQHFVKWLERTVTEQSAHMSAEIVWKLAGSVVVAREIFSLCVYPRNNLGRFIDIEISLEALGGTLELQGAPDQDKGYGGFCIRGAPVLTEAVMTTDEGPLEKDATNVPFRWADLSTQDLGIAIFVSSRHPDFPIPWLIRNSYAGVLNPSWPGLKSVVLQPSEPVTLSYRVYIHSGDVNEGGVAAAYARYIGSIK